MMPIYKERVYNPWPFDKEEAVANLVQKRVSKSRNVKLMTIYEDSDIGRGDLGRTDIRLDVLFEQKQKVSNNEGANDGMTTAEEAEQTCVIDDSGTKEEENVEEDEVVEDQLDRLKKQYNTVCEVCAEWTTASDRWRKEEENIGEDGVVED